MTIDFRNESLSDLASRVRSKQISSRELVQAALDRAAEINPKVNAFRVIDADGALKAADAIDDRIAKGEDVGPLAGIPLAVKDVENALGFQTCSGSATRKDDPPADRDSVQVARLKAAGCVVIGKTNTPEFGLKPQTDSPAFGVTRNPWDLTKTPGGSSGGTSAALASGIVPLATGSDGGGSIRIPSSVTGLSGLKPSLGRVPDGDVKPTGWQYLSTRGVMSRKIRDVAYALDVVVGPHPWDIRSIPREGGSWFDALSSPAAPKRAAWCPTLGYADVDDEVRAVCERAVKTLEAQGTEIVVVDKVFDADPTTHLGTLVSTFMLRTVEPFLGTDKADMIDPLVVISAELARVNTNAIDVVRAYDACHTVNLELQRVLDDVDVLLTPTVSGTACPCESMTTVAELLPRLGGIEAFDTTALDMELVTQLLERLSRIGEFNFPMGMINGEAVLDWTRMTQPFNMTRSPAGTVNAGFTGAGLPVGLQIVGQQHGDVGVLQAIAVLEDALAIDRVAQI